MIGRMKSALSLAFIVLSAALLSQALFPLKASALLPTNIAPTPASSNPGGAQLVVGHGAYEAPRMQVHMYVPGGGNVNINVPGICDNQAGVDVAGYRAKTKVFAEAGPATSPSMVCHAASTTFQSNNSPVNITLYDAAGNPTSYRQITVYVEVYDYIGSGDYENSFTIESSTPGVLVAYVSDLGFYTGIYHRGISQPTWDVSIDFAPQCESGTNSRDIEFFDSDADAGNYQDGNPISWRISRQLRLGGTGFVPFGNGYLNGAGGVVDSSGPISFNDDYIYRLELGNIVRRNSVQVRLPFSQIWSLDHCEPPPPPPSEAPFFTVENGLTWSGGQIDARNEVTGGGWGEYGIFANGIITKFGSDSSNANRTLMFANNGQSGNFGFPVSSPNGRAKQAYDNIESTVSTTSIPAGSVPSSGPSKKIYKISGNLHISNDIIGNLAYPIGSFDDLRSVILLVDGDVSIDPSVTEIHAIIVATGNINTCASAGMTTHPTNSCQDKLVVLGGMVADGYIAMNRIGTSSDRRAEAIIGSPEMMDNVYELVGGGDWSLGKYRELPPIIND